MTAFRCTAKLLKAMKEAPEADPASAGNRLGEWTATLVRVGRIQLVLAVSEPTRFAVAIDAAPCATAPQRFAAALLAALLDLEIPADLAVAKIEAMLPLQVVASNSRSVLGSLNQFAWWADCAICSREATSAREVPLDLARMIVLKPKGIDWPADRVREAFGLPPVGRRASRHDVPAPGSAWR
ncbi:hypothetical protein RHOFW510R12_16320 [Rhodanobacter sp. FW510-R12]|uniref:DUF6933 domain-containing protein n=1 Tax=Rhodanobacter thiooxydans TaxID=416169 RepID=UPI0003FB9CBF|nr:hypothetical protein [Rhodanobacter thiooxydans]TAN16500.1 MAG: hypothetical protein EPN35_10065 [Rhodanobacter sp.]UJJ54525.1 hypothetical protein LRK53_16465 [Rhodanobacter thiooxydans]